MFTLGLVKAREMAFTVGGQFAVALRTAHAVIAARKFPPQSVSLGGVAPHSAAVRHSPNLSLPKTAWVSEPIWVLTWV